MARPSLLLSAVLLAPLLAAPILAPRARADENRDRFFEGQAALGHGDCKAAVEALEAVRSSLRQDPKWLLATAKAHDCAGNLDKALGYYLELDKRTPDDNEIGKAIGDLRYRIKRRKQDEVRDAERTKTAALQRKRRIEQCQAFCTETSDRCGRAANFRYGVCRQDCRDEACRRVCTEEHREALEDCRGGRQSCVQRCPDDPYPF